MAAQRREIESPFGAGGEWLRCALHAHTTNSDGELAPERLALHYERAGYDVLCIVLALGVAADPIVRCSPAASAALISSRRFGAQVNAGRMGYASRGRVVGEAAGGIVEARLDRWSSLPYGRVEVKDAFGETAWTNPSG
jgi:hypothetical protein